MAVELGLPVPPACTITTEACRAFLATGWPDGLDEELRAQVARLEERVGRRFGDPARPAARLRAVRRPAVDARDDGHDPQPRAQRRDRGGPGGGVRRPGVRPRLPRAVPRDVPLGRGRRGARGPVAAAARRDRGRVPLLDERAGGAPTGGSRGSRTTSGPASRSRRWCSATSARTRGTGVLFTRNPATGEDEPYGDVLFDAQGEDVVAGTHATEPIAVLDTRLPAVAAELRRDAGRPRAPLPRLLRHRVHDRARPAVAAPGPGRQADAAGRAADGRGHGRGPGVPADARGGGAARGGDPRGPADGGRRSAARWASR